MDDCHLSNITKLKKKHTNTQTHGKTSYLLPTYYLATKYLFIFVIEKREKSKGHDVNIPPRSQIPR
jgi:hypothetical protein